MDEKEEIMIPEKRKDNFAFISVIAGIVSFGSMCLFVILGYLVSTLEIGSYFDSVGIMLFQLIILSVLISFISSVIALIKPLKTNSGIVVNLKLAVLGLAISLIMGTLTICLCNSMSELRTIRLVCPSNLNSLAKSILVYSQDSDQKIPTPSKWCDLLIKYADTQEKIYRCPEAKKTRSKTPVSNYAINPNARLVGTEDQDVVLLFETQSGWNQFGGPELITAENHKGKGCNVAYVSTKVEFVKKEDFGKLNWGEKKQEEK